MKFTSFILPLLVIFVAACADNLDEEKRRIEKYIISNGWKTIDTSGVYVFIEDQGTADRPIESSEIELSYTAKYIDDVVFDQSPADGNVTLKLSSAIKGLKYGLAKFGKEGKGSIIIPSNLGYGNNPPFGIRKGAVLIYNVTIINF